MADGGGTPLTDFLIDLAHDEDLVKRFREHPEEVLKERGLSGHPKLQGELSLADIHEAVVEEHGREDVYVSFWILVGKLPLPMPWILASRTADDENDEPNLGGSGGGTLEPQ